jgi:hypothetical protein
LQEIRTIVRNMETYDEGAYHCSRTDHSTRTSFFERRRSVITRAFGSPKIPRTVG